MIATSRLDLDIPTASDLDGLHAINGDPRLWEHYPSLRHTEVEQTRSMLERWIDAWARVGLSPWTVRERGDAWVVGYGGCALRDEAFWNLGYRFAANRHGRGYATELSLEAVRQAASVRSDLPVVAYMLESNPASIRVAEKVGLGPVHRGPDAGNPDPSAVRLVYASRPLTPDELALVMA